MVDHGETIFPVTASTMTVSCSETRCRDKHPLPICDRLSGPRFGTAYRLGVRIAPQNREAPQSAGPWQAWQRQRAARETSRHCREQPQPEDWRPITGTRLQKQQCTLAESWTCGCAFWWPNELKLSDRGWRGQAWTARRSRPPASVRWSAWLGRRRADDANVASRVTG